MTPDASGAHAVAEPSAKAAVPDRTGPEAGSLQSWLLTGLFFCIPLPIAAAYVLSAVLLVVWLVERRAEVGRHMPRTVSPLPWIFLAYYAVLLASVAWSADSEWAWRMVRRQNFFLLFLLYFSAARRTDGERHLSAFLLAMALCELLAFYNWTRMHWMPDWPAGIHVRKDPADSAPFVDHILYAPMLAFAAYLAAHRFLFGLRRRWWRWLHAALFAATAGNLLISGGRAGVIGFLALLMLLIVQRLGDRPLRALLVAGTVATVLALAGYHGSDYLGQRVDEMVDELADPGPDSPVSIRSRLVYAQNAWRIFVDHPWAGVGIGDYPQVYAQVNAQHTPDWEPAWNPHNQYLYALTAAGIAGGAALLAVLLVPLLLPGPIDGLRHVRRALPLFFILLCFSESYLMRSNTSLMYVLFTASLWARGDRETRSGRVCGPQGREPGRVPEPCNAS